MIATTVILAHRDFYYIICKVKDFSSLRKKIDYSERPEAD